MQRKYKNLFTKTDCLQKCVGIEKKRMWMKIIKQFRSHIFLTSILFLYINNTLVIIIIILFVSKIILFDESLLMFFFNFNTY